VKPPHHADDTPAQLPLVTPSPRPSSPARPTPSEADRPATTRDRDPRRVLETVFGYPTFRGRQEEIVRHVIAGGDALVLMPTGGGKSLCYQIPAIVRSGAGIVVSPLIALMQDQVEALREAGVAATLINSTLTPAVARERERALLAGRFDLVYVSPERLLTDPFLELLDRSPLALFAIDEAHCVSQWGHDFRPEYRGLDVLARRYPKVPRIALTATADEPTRREILEHLSLPRAGLFVAGFDRPNLRYEVVAKTNAPRQLVSFLRARHDGEAGIVYCLTRAKVEETAERLAAEGVRAVPYHAGLDREVRERNQRRFQEEDGLVVVATIAFGMGIDKPDVRFVAHLDLPKSLEAYYQETGRAGRDGLPADAWMCYGLADAVRIRQLVERSDAPAERKRIEHRKLSTLLGYCESAECRRAILLRYFGESHAGGCGNCDTCLQPVATWDGTEPARKALSNVYRTGQRFGAAYLTSVLLGEEDQRVTRNGHTRLSTFGIGAELDRSAWLSVHRQLVAAGLLEVEAEHGGLRLAPDAWPLLRGERSLRLRRDLAPRAARAAGAAERSRRGRSVDALLRAQVDRDLFEALRQRRLELARERGVPPYVIFHDRTLLEMVHSRPRTLAAMAAVPGVGEHKLAEYGEAFLAVVQLFPSST
jgi:ATP-dependent DNA helicase RecQ